MHKPNIIYIMADDMGYGDLGCYGATKIPTPHMDRIAAEGVRLTDAHSSSAVCTPSRYAVLTGRYAWRGGLKRWVLGGYGTPLIEPERLTVASLLKAGRLPHRGRRQVACGAGLAAQRRAATRPIIDFGNPAWSVDGFDIDHSAPIGNGPTTLGFDSYFGIAGSLDMPPYCFIENDHTVGIPDREKEVYYNQQRKGMQTPDWQDDQVDITLAAKAVEFIEAASAAEDDAPFFLYLTPASPHRPCDVRPDFVVGASDAGDRGDMVVLFDWVVGQVLDALDRTGQADNTLIIVTSDNGGRLTCADGETYGHASNGSLRGQKADIWDGGHREPFVARWPQRIPAGSKSATSSSAWPTCWPPSLRLPASTCPQTQARTPSTSCPPWSARRLSSRSARRSSTTRATVSSPSARGAGSWCWAWAPAASASRLRRTPRRAGRRASSTTWRPTGPRRTTCGPHGRTW